MTCDHDYQPYFGYYFPFTQTEVVGMQCTRCDHHYTQSFCTVDT